MSLSEEMGITSPKNHVHLPPESKRRIWDRDFTIREITCDTCKTVLCAVIIEDVHEADCIWPFDVICETPIHRLVPKGTEGAVKLFCKGRAAQEWEAKKYIERYK